MKKNKAKKRDKALENLRRTYKYFDDVYFNGTLRCEVEFGDIKEDGITRLIHNGLQRITIHKDLKTHPDLSAIILLHEMMHVKLNQENYTDTQKGHGLRFNAGIDMLYQRGAYGLLL